MAITISLQLQEETCITCGCVFAFPEDLKRGLRETHRSFYCPVGHPMFYPSETDEERLRKLYLKERLDKEALQTELTTLKKRMNAGICLYCHRHFANVERHLKTKHQIGA